jgi:hypothetical protein
MGYTGWNRFGSGKYWLDPDEWGCNRFKPVKTYVKWLSCLKSGWPTQFGTGLEAASTGQD